MQIRRDKNRKIRMFVHQNSSVICKRGGECAN